jgi:glycerol uptake facilitator-like aquaporin
MTGSTCINPAVGICLQFVAAWARGDWAVFYRDVWPLIVPSIIGAIFGGFFMKKIYEPLLLYIKYKDLEAEDMEHLDEDKASQEGEEDQ